MDMLIFIAIVLAVGFALDHYKNDGKVLAWLKSKFD